MKARYTRLLLLPSGEDAALRELKDALNPTRFDRFEVTVAEQTQEAVDRLQAGNIDIVLIDGRIDPGNATSIARLREVASDVPIMVLTGEDQTLIDAAMAAGADDCLHEDDLHAKMLRRALGIAITRRRETKIRDLEASLKQYEALAGSSPHTKVTAELTGQASFKTRHPEEFGALVGEYEELLRLYLQGLIVAAAKPREGMEALIVRIGDAGGGPRDLIDLHLTALNKAAESHNEDRINASVAQGRLMVLEMMGLLVDYYRIGLRRRSVEGKVA